MLPGVTVTVRGPTGPARTVITDTNGRYVIAHVAPGTYELTFELSGFTGQTRTAVVTAGEPTSIETRLEIGSRTEAVQVTGTLIPRPTLEAMSPVTTIDVEELTYQGITGSKTSSPPSRRSSTAQNSTIANGSSGTATVDLRELGDYRTLVLLDGAGCRPGR